MNTLRYADPVVITEETSSDDPDSGHSSMRGVHQTDRRTATAPGLFEPKQGNNSVTQLQVVDPAAPDRRQDRRDGQTLSFEVKHSIAGRLRLHVNNLAELPGQQSGSLIDSLFFPGILAVRCNTWCSSVVIDYDPAIWTEERLLQCLRKLKLNAPASSELAPVMKSYRTPSPFKWLGNLARFLERLFPPPFR